MTIETAYFAVQRGANQYKCLGSELNDKLQVGDLLAVQHENETTAKKWAYGDINQVLDSDWLACTDTDGVTYKVRGDKFKDLFGPPWTKYTIWFHVRNATEEVRLNYPKTAFDSDGTNERTISSFGPGDDLVIVQDQPRVHRLFEKNETASWDFGPLTDTTRMTSFDFIFNNCKAFDGDVGYIDVSNVDGMTSNFVKCYAFTGKGIEKWRAPKLQYMNYMFNDTNAFNGDISNLNPCPTSCEYTFKNAKAFNRDISKWDMSRCDKSREMFYGAEKFNQPIGSWDVSKMVPRTESGRTTFNMQSMFRNCQAFNQDLSEWCVPEHTEKPYNFDAGSGFAYQTHLQPQWGTCPRGEDQA